MLKITMESPGNFKFDDVAEPVIKDEEALLEIKSVGICASDICQYKGEKLDILPLPVVQGHEFGGIVLDIKGPSNGIKIGDKVTVNPHKNCGDCYYCNHDMGLTCDNDKLSGINVEGGMVERKAVPTVNVVKLGDDFDIRYSGIIEPATVAYHLVNRVKNSNIMIIGVGSIGTMAVPLIKFNGNRLISIDIDDRHLKVAEKLGSDLNINVLDKEREQKILNFLGKEKLDFVALTHLDQDVLDLSFNLLKRCGIIEFIAIVDDPFFKVDFKKMWRKIITIKGLDSFFPSEFIETAKLVDKKIINPPDVVEKIFPLRDIIKAYEYKINNNALKVILTN